MPQRYAFVMDPIERVLVDKDTTFVFMLEAQARGHELYYLHTGDMFAVGTETRARLRRVEVARAEKHYHLYEERTEPLTWCDAVFMRKDPPFDLDFFFATHLLSLIDPRRTFVLNRPSGLREANEKLYAMRFPEVTPRTIVSADMQRLRSFMEELGGEMIIKPLDGCGGAGVFHLGRADRNLNSILETATQNGTRMMMGQQYVPEVRQGDKRLIVLDGEPLGGVLRVPREDETRGNIHVGGNVVRTEVSDRDREICRRLAPSLRADGLYFVGLDIIGGYLTEVNVTSPTGIQEINALNGVKLEAKVIDFVERQVNRLRTEEE